MNAQQRFRHLLENSQALCAAGPDKMPYLCVIGTQDFDELRAEVESLYEQRDYLSRIEDRLANEWDPLNPSCEQFSALRERIEQEEFGREQASTLDTPAASPIIAEVGASLDPRQKASLTEWFEYCGCRCFRALSGLRGFWFA
jgi:hypothetical protein